MNLLPPAATDFVARFGLRYPILQAPTGSIAGPELAIAVTNAGGMGALALTWTPPDLAAGYVRQVRKAVSGPFLVNFALAFPPLALPAALEQGAPILSFSWGDPAPYIGQVRDAGAKWGVQVTNEAGVRYALDLGADFLICQGIEAGGHVQSTTALHSLLPRIVNIANALGTTPVIASGGMATGADIAYVLQQGASAAMLGTRFVATQESRAHEDYKQKLVQSDATDTALTVCFDGGWPYAPHRVLRNTTLEAWEAAGCPPIGRRPGEGDVTGVTAQGEHILRYEDTAPRVGFTGEVEAMCLYAGTGCGKIDAIPVAEDIVHRLWQECAAVLS